MKEETVRRTKYNKVSSSIQNTDTWRSACTNCTKILFHLLYEFDVVKQTKLLFRTDYKIKRFNEALPYPHLTYFTFCFYYVRGVCFMYFY